MGGLNNCGLTELHSQCEFLSLAGDCMCIFQVGWNSCMYSWLKLYVHEPFSCVFRWGELVITLFASQARALLWQCPNQTLFILLLAVCKLESVCCFKVSVLIQYLRFYFGTWFAWSCNTKKCKGKALSLPSWPCLSCLQCFLYTAQKLLIKPSICVLLIIFHTSSHIWQWIVLMTTVRFVDFVIVHYNCQYGEINQTLANIYKIINIFADKHQLILW